MGVCQRHAPAALFPGKRQPLYRRLGGSQGRSGRERKICPSPGFDSRTVQPVASRRTDYAILNHAVCGSILYVCIIYQYLIPAILYLSSLKRD